MLTPGKAKSHLNQQKPKGDGLVWITLIGFTAALRIFSEEHFGKDGTNEQLDLNDKIVADTLSICLEKSTNAD